MPPQQVSLESVLSFSLERELEGVFKARSHVSQATLELAV